MPRRATGRTTQIVRWSKSLWDDIQKFLTRLNAQEAGNIPRGWAYVLPTEAQWEYACRAGTTTAYSWGDEIASDDANYNWDGTYNTGADFKRTRDVGQYSANPWGFFDMHGNVYEWTADWNAGYSPGEQTDPVGPATGSQRVLRGGSWSTPDTGLRSADRYYTAGPSYRYSRIGFRVGFQKIHLGQSGSTHEADLNSTVSLEMIWVEPGTFTMGSPTRKLEVMRTETQHEVTLTKGFYLGKYEVTQAQYEAVMTGNTDRFECHAEQLAE